MPSPASDPVSTLVRAYADGDTDAFTQLVPLVYEELRGLAARIGAHGTLQPTALVHEAVLKLASGRGGLQDKPHFLAVAARAMRHLLADHARRRGAWKRGGAAKRVTLDVELLADEDDATDLVRLDEALEALEALDARQARIVELRYFGGLTNREVAELVDVSLRTVELDLQMARGFLRRKMEG